MVDDELLQYIKDHKDSYGIRKLKEGLIKQGVSREEIEEAIDQLDREEDEGEPVMEKEWEEEKKPIVRESREDVDRVSNRTDQYFQKADSILHGLLKLIGVVSNERGFYGGVIKYGSASFVMTTIIVVLFQYIAGRLVYPSVAEGLGALGPLALPDVFIAFISLWSLIKTIIISAIWGAILSFVFVRYCLAIWPFKIWKVLSKKVFALYFIVFVFFGIIIDGIIVSFSSEYWVGYFIILIGMAVGSYVGSFYLSDALHRNYDEHTREMVRKSW